VKLDYDQPPEVYNPEQPVALINEIEALMNGTDEDGNDLSAGTVVGYSIYGGQDFTHILVDSEGNLTEVDDAEEFSDTLGMDEQDYDPKGNSPKDKWDPEEFAQPDYEGTYSGTTDTVSIVGVGSATEDLGYDDDLYGEGYDESGSGEASGPAVAPSSAYDGTDEGDGTDLG
jgi:hypothetical protein